MAVYYKPPSKKIGYGYKVTTKPKATTSSKPKKTLKKPPTSSAGPPTLKTPSTSLGKAIQAQAGLPPALPPSSGGGSKKGKKKQALQEGMRTQALATAPTPPGVGFQTRASAGREPPRPTGFSGVRATGVGAPQTGVGAALRGLGEATGLTRYTSPYEPIISNVGRAAAQAAGMPANIIQDIIRRRVLRQAPGAEQGTAGDVARSLSEMQPAELVGRGMQALAPAMTFGGLPQTVMSYNRLAGQYGMPQVPNVPPFPATAPSAQPTLGNTPPVNLPIILQPGAAGATAVGAATTPPQMEQGVGVGGAPIQGMVGEAQRMTGLAGAWGMEPGLTAEQTALNIPWRTLGFEDHTQGSQWANDFNETYGYWPWEGPSSEEENLGRNLATYYQQGETPPVEELYGPYYGEGEYMPYTDEGYMGYLSAGYGGGFWPYFGGYGGGGGGGYSQQAPPWWYANMQRGV